MQMHADKPISEVAKETGLQVYTIRYILRNLAEKEIIVRVPWINIMTVGYHFLGVYFSVLPEGSRDIGRMLTYLKTSPQVVWLAELGGDFNYGISLCVESVYSVEEYLAELTTQFPNVIGSKVIELQFSVTRFSRGYLHLLSGKKFDRSPMTMTHRGGMVALDDTDKKVLGALTRFNNESMRAMAQKIKMPLSTFELRAKKLAEKQVILGHMFELNPSEIGRQMHKIIISTKSWRSGFFNELVTYAASHPCTVALYSGAGQWDFELNIEVADNSEISSVSTGLLQKFGNNIASLKVIPKYRDLKHVLVPF